MAQLTFTDSSDLPLKLYQWDVDRIVIIRSSEENLLSIDEVQCTNEYQRNAISVTPMAGMPDGGIKITLPNELLRRSTNVIIYVWQRLDGSEERTLIEGSIPVIARAKPLNYHDAEYERQQNELDRIAAEEARQAAELARQSAEATRRAAEIIRIENENERNSAERNRTANESTRNNNERERIDNEAERVAAEAERVANEIAREALAAEITQTNIDAQNAILDANQATQESQDATLNATSAANVATTAAENANTATQNANTATAAANIATSNANAAAVNAETATTNANTAAERANAAATACEAVVDDVAEAAAEQIAAVIDLTLSVSNKAADAGETGRRFETLNATLGVSPATIADWDGGYISIPTVGSALTLTRVPNATFQSAYLPAQEGDIITLTNVGTGASSGSGGFAYGIVDDNMIVIAKSARNASFNNAKITMPAGAAYIVANNQIASQPAPTLSIGELDVINSRIADANRRLYGEMLDIIKDPDEYYPGANLERTSDVYAALDAIEAGAGNRMSHIDISDIIDDDTSIRAYVINTSPKRIGYDYTTIDEPFFNKPKFLITSCIHGNERANALFMISFIKNLLSNPKYSEIAGQFEWHILPVVNVWGFNHTMVNNTTGAIVWYATNSNYTIVENTAELMGGVRNNADDININRDFNDVRGFRTAEARAVRDYFISLNGCIGAIDFHQWWNTTQRTVMGFSSMAPNNAMLLEKYKRCWCSMAGGAKEAEDYIRAYTNADDTKYQMAFMWGADDDTTTTPTAHNYFAGVEANNTLHQDKAITFSSTMESSMIAKFLTNNGNVPYQRLAQISGNVFTQRMIVAVAKAALSEML